VIVDLRKPVARACRNDHDVARAVCTRHRMKCLHRRIIANAKSAV
jgi:hypothetical protein